MKHQRFWEYCEEGTPSENWKPTTAEELLFELIPSGKVAAYRLIIVNLDVPKRR